MVAFFLITILDHNAVSFFFWLGIIRFSFQHIQIYSSSILSQKKSEFLQHKLTRHDICFFSLSLSLSPVLFGGVSLCIWIYCMRLYVSVSLSVCAVVHINPHTKLVRAQIVYSIHIYKTISANISNVQWKMAVSEMWCAGDGVNMHEKLTHASNKCGVVVVVACKNSQYSRIDVKYGLRFGWI